MALGQFFAISTAGNNGVECRVYVAISDDPGNNRSFIDAELQFRKNNGFASQGNSFGTFTINGTGITISGNRTLPSNGAWVSFGFAGTHQIDHGADGRAPLTYVNVNSVGISGSSDFDTAVTGVLSFDSGNGFADYQRLPGQVAQPSWDQITPTSARIDWAAPASAVAIGQYDLHVCRDTNFNGTNCPHYNWTGNTNTSKVISGLNPGTQYHGRVRAQSSEGEGAWSPTASFTTLPSTPAILTSVTPNATGNQATVVVAPPSGIVSVNSYNIEARTPGGSWTLVASGSANPSQVISGRVPGQTYEWRASAVIGTYTSPTSSTITVTQPQPNASPGSYWDGATTDTPSTNYTFTGTPGSSTSQAQTLTGGAVGWLSGAQAVAASGGTAVQYQVAGSLEPNGNGGSWTVRYTMLTGASSNGFRAGLNGTTGYADVTVNGQYMGSLWVKSSRARTLAAMWVWYNNVGAVIGTTLGASVDVGTAAIRLSVLGTAPAGAVKGAVVITDPSGSSMMQASDVLDIDAGMGSTGTLYPYFDGNTPDTAQSTYSWQAAAQTSPSIREDIPVAAQNPLLDPDCPPLPVPPAPPTIPDDCIVPVGSWRRTWYRVDASNVPAFLSAVPTVTLGTFGYAESQVRIRWYENPTDIEPLLFDASSWEFEQIISYIPPCTTITLDGVSRRAWAEVGVRTGAGTAGDPYVCVPGDYPSIPADSLLRGSNNTPPTWPVLTCGYTWLISLDTPLDAPVGNLVVEAGLTVRE